MATLDEIEQLIGTIVCNCGLLEALTNTAIRKLATDKLLIAEILTIDFSRRINVLQRLLEDRTKLPTEKVKSFCNQLSAIATERNIVAHNPILSESSHSNDFHIIKLRGLTDATEVSNARMLTKKDLEDLRERTSEALATLESILVDAGIVKNLESAYQETKV